MTTAEQALLASPGWSSTGPMLYARVYETATLLPSGEVLAVGGIGTAAQSTAERYDPKTGVWTKTLGDMSIARAYHTGTLLPNGKVLVAGGIDDNAVAAASAELYNPATDTWSKTKVDMTSARYQHTATPLPNGKVLVAGGADGTNTAVATAEIYDPGTDQWTKTPGNMSTARLFHTATLLPNGKVLVTGGGNSVSYSTLTAELFDPSTGMWTSAGSGSMSIGRRRHTATLLPNGKVLVAGGDVVKGTETASADLYDPATGLWTPTGPMTVVRDQHTATLLPNGKVLVAGGRDSSDNPYLTAELYDPAKGTWSKTANNMTVAHSEHATVLLPSGAVLLMGGKSALNVVIPTAELYDPGFSVWTAAGAMSAARATETATLLPSGKVLVAGGAIASAADVFTLAANGGGTWAKTGSMNVMRALHMGTLLGNGNVLVAGGQGLFNTVLSAAEVYTPGTNQWTLTGSMTGARYIATTTLLQGGKVLAAGGLTMVGSSTPVATAELYDPVTQTWSATGKMNAGRYRHTATLLLPSGKVLVAGGGGGTPPYLRLAELYDPATGTWTPTSGLMTIERTDHTATLLPSGKVLVAGGQFGAILASAELYDPATGTWTRTAGDMVSPRHGHTATLLDPDATGAQRVLITGGDSAAAAQSSAEVYDPVTDHFQPVSPMLAARFYHTATKLTDGSVLVAGGINDINNQLGSTLSSAERYARTGNGALCLFGGDCLSEVCADGVCCNGACPHDGCHACAFAAGAQTDGVCATFADGFICTDNDACTAVDTCQAGSCVGTQKKVCPGPADACHLADTCDPLTAQCQPVAAPDGTQCVSGDKCSLAAVCKVGVCQSLATLACPLPDPCHLQGACDPLTGICSTPPVMDGLPCDDNSKCTQVDQCVMGVCTGMLPIACLPPDQCHKQSTCDPLTGLCDNPQKDDGALCDDGDACTQPDICLAGVCTGQSPVICPAPDPCHDQGVCDKATGMCSNPAKSEGASCDDGDACTTLDRCQSEVCVGQSPVVCPEPDQCHKPSTCDKATGLCDNPVKDEGAGCDSDHDPCTEGDHCAAGVCVTGAPKACGAYACDKATGECLGACASVHDCAAGQVCNRSHRCVAPPALRDAIDDSGCALAPLTPPARSPGGPSGLTLLALLTLLARRRRTPGRA